jgi:hypothetical protein
LRAIGTEQRPSSLRFLRNETNVSEENMYRLTAAGVGLLLTGVLASNANATPISAAGNSLKQATPQSDVVKAWYHGRHYGWYRGRHYGWYRRP